MIVLRLEMHPSDGGPVRDLGRVEIANVDGDESVASYEVKVTSATPVPWDRFMVFNHRRSLGAWELARRALSPAARVVTTPRLREWAEDLLVQLRGELDMRRGGMQAGTPDFPPSVAIRLERELTAALEEERP